MADPEKEARSKQLKLKYRLVQALSYDLVEYADMLITDMDMTDVAKFGLALFVHNRRDYAKRSIGIIKWLTRRFDGTGVLTAKLLSMMVRPELATRDVVEYILGKYKFSINEYAFIARRWGAVDPDVADYIKEVRASVRSGTWVANVDDPSQDAPFTPRDLGDNRDGDLDSVYSNMRTTLQIPWLFMLSFHYHQSGPRSRWTHRTYISYIIKEAIVRNNYDGVRLLLDNYKDYPETRDLSIPLLVMYKNVNMYIRSHELIHFILDNYELTTEEYTALDTPQFAHYRGKIEMMHAWATIGEWRPWTAQQYNPAYQDAMRTLLMLAKA